MDLLSSKEKSELRGYAQRLKPAIHVGKKGLVDTLMVELRKAFQKEELIKVAFKGDREVIASQCAEIESLTGSQCVGGVGKKRSFYRKLELVTEEA